jgi:hypothetical protein
MLARYGITIAVVFVLSTQQSGFCQAVSFGKVSLEELKMTMYERDTAAGAVVLSDIGEFNGQTLKFKRHLRVKVLKKSGLGFGNWTFNVPFKGEFKVLVFNFINGQLVKEKANNNSIYNEEVLNGFEVYKVFAPNVMVGSVIDIEYSHFGLPFEWWFQNTIPIVYSQLTVYESARVTFSKTHFGFEPIQTISDHEWRATNMPAFKIEPFLNNYKNYVTKFQFQVVSFGMAGRYNFDISSSWRKVNDFLMDLPGFGGVLNGAAFLNDFAKETKSKNISTVEKITEAFDYIQSNIKWNGEKALLATNGIRANFLTNHTGNSAEINLCLIALLNKMDIATFPVALSTRDNGMLAPHAPSFDKLNYVVAYVRHEGVEMFLDATSEEFGPGYVPVYCLNGQGLFVKRQNEQWLTLNKAYSDSKKQFVTINIDAQGNAKAKITQDVKEYAFVNWADNQKANNNDKEVSKNKLKKEYPDIEILSYEVNKKDKKTASAKETIEANISSQLIDAGDAVIFNPFVMFDYSKNEFKSEDRKYPVDLVYPKEINTTIVVQLPKEYSVKKLPESIKFANPDGTASFTYLASAAGSGIQFKATLKLTKYVFSDEEYKELRRFFSEVAKKINEPLELVKS